MFERNRIAETLRNAREKQGLSLEQAAAGAGIPLQYLRLLEGESNVQIGVSDELYLIPFFRRYARFFGIDAEELLPEFLGLVQQLPGEGSPPIRLTYRSRWGFLWKPLAVLLGVTVAVLLLQQAPRRSGFDAENGNESESVSGPLGAPATEPTAGTEPVASSVVLAIENSPDSKASPPGPSPHTSPSVPPAEGHLLSIAALEESWLSLTVDDQAAKQYLLREGEVRSWTAKRFSLTVGNAGGIALTIDGRELPPIGLPGQVVRGLRLPQAAPTASPAAP